MFFSSFEIEQLVSPVRRVIQTPGVVLDMQDSPDNPSAVAADEALASFVLLAKFLGMPAEPEQIHHDRGQGDKPYDFDDLIRIAKKLGLMARRRLSTFGDLAKLPLPALVALRDGGTAILLKVDESGEAMLAVAVQTDTFVGLDREAQAAIEATAASASWRVESVTPDGRMRKAVVTHRGRSF